MKVPCGDGNNMEDYEDSSCIENRGKDQGSPEDQQYK